MVLKKCSLKKRRKLCELSHFFRCFFFNFFWEYLSKPFPHFKCPDADHWWSAWGVALSIENTRVIRNTTQPLPSRVGWFIKIYFKSFFFSNLRILSGIILRYVPEVMKFISASRSSLSCARPATASSEQSTPGNKTNCTVPEIRFMYF